MQDAKYDPFGNLTQPASVFDTSTAQFLNQPGGFQAPMSIDQATEQATKRQMKRLVPVFQPISSEKVGLWRPVERIDNSQGSCR